MVLLAWVLGTLVGCGGDKAGDDTGGGQEETCEVQISETVPSGGASDFYYRGTIEVYFTAADSEGSVTLMDSAGTEVAGATSWSEDGTVLYFTPSTPLSPSTDYTLMIDYCGGNPEVAFRTSEVGGEADVNSLVGKAYEIDLGSARFVEPAGIGAILGEVLSQSILVGVLSADESSIQMVGAISDDEATTVQQDMCTESIAFPAADFSENPFFAIGPQDTTISIAGYSATIKDLEVSGAFGPDLSYFSGGVLGGEVDSTELDDIADLQGYTGCDGTDDACLCDFIAGTGFATCSECSDGSGPYCLVLLADQIVAYEIEGSVVELSAEDVAANPACAE